METLEHVLQESRNSLGLGVRELCRKAEGRDYVAETISPTYYSRLERGGAGHCTTDKVSMDRLWAIGTVLRLSPTLLLCLSRGVDPEDYVDRKYGVADVDHKQSFGVFVRNRRLDLCLSLRQVDVLSRRTPFPVSSGFWSQFETNFREQSGSLSGDKIMGIALVLDVDPLLLYVLSRELPERLLTKASRDALFS